MDTPQYSLPDKLFLKAKKQSQEIAEQHYGVDVTLTKYEFDPQTGEVTFLWRPVHSLWLNPMEFTADELFESAKEHHKTADIGLRVGPNIGYVRVYRRCAWAMRIVADVLKNRWRHLKRGSEYYEIGRAKLQSGKTLSEGESLVVYIAFDGTLWARPETEFEDGRFERVTA